MLKTCSLFSIYYSHLAGKYWCSSAVQTHVCTAIYLLQHPISRDLGFLKIACMSGLVSGNPSAIQINKPARPISHGEKGCHILK